MKKLILIFATILLLTSCGPIYRDFYDHHQPDDREGRMCVNTCSSVKSQCVDNCVQRNQECEQHHRTIREKEESNCYRKKEYCLKNPADAECKDYMSRRCDEYYSHSNCSMSDCKQSCNSHYDQCFVNCGGAIVKRTECVFNCDAAH